MSKLMKLDIQFFSDDVDVSYTNIYEGADVVKVRVEIRKAVMLGDEITGYSIFEPVDGWTLSDNNTKLTKTFDYNYEGTIELRIPATYNLEDGQIMTFPSVIETYARIKVNTIKTSDYIESSVSYNKVYDGNSKLVESATVTVTMTNDSSYRFSSENTKANWVISNDGIKMTREAYSNDNYAEDVFVYLSGEADSESTRSTASVSYYVSKIGLRATPTVSYKEKMQGNDVIGVEVSIIIPYTLGSESGYEEITGREVHWSVSDDSIRATRLYLENTDGEVSIYTKDAESDAVFSTTSEYRVRVTVNQINYKKEVKGRCEKSKCLYDVYTKTEMDNYKLRAEEEKKILQRDIEYLNDQIRLLWDIVNGNTIVSEEE